MPQRASVGIPDDLDRFRGLLALLDEHGLVPRRVAVADIEVELCPTPSYESGDVHPIESDREREEREDREYQAIMYAASEGPDFS